MYISGAKFKEHHSNICRDILDSVFYCFSDTKKKDISKTREDNPNRKTPFFFTLKPFQISSKYSLTHRHLNNE